MRVMMIIMVFVMMIFVLLIFFITVIVVMMAVIAVVMFMISVVMMRGTLCYLVRVMNNHRYFRLDHITDDHCECNG